MGNRKDHTRADVVKELRDEINALEIFDAEAWLGKSAAFPLMEEGTAGLLDELQRRHGIKGALVSHWLQKKHPVYESNKHLLDNIEGHENWHAVITGLPLFPEDKWFIDSPKVKAVRVYPSTFFFPLADWCTGSLCSMLEEKRMPLFVFHTETNLGDIHGLAKRFPAMKIVLESQVKKIIYHARTVLALMKECPSVYLEISNWHGSGLLEYTAENIGSSRMILGSFMPANDPLVSVGLVLHSNLSLAGKKMIAGGNIREILSGVRT